MWCGIFDVLGWVVEGVRKEGGGGKGRVGRGVEMMGERRLGGMKVWFMW